MDKIKIHVLRTGEVRVSPYLPFGGDNCSIIKASGLTTPKKGTPKDDRSSSTSEATYVERMLAFRRGLILVSGRKAFGDASGTNAQNQTRADFMP